MESGWDDTALRSVFLRGLSDQLRDELAIRDETCSLEDLIALAIQLDNRLRERRRERQDRTYGQSEPSAGSEAGANSSHRQAHFEASSGSDPGVEPMQVGRTRLSVAERRRRTMNSLCLYCGKGGHFVDSCPLTGKGGVHQRLGARW